MTMIKMLLRTYLVLFIFTASARADFVPESTYQRYLSYGLLFDDQSSLFLRGRGGRVLGSLSGTLPIWEPAGTDFHPQLTFTTSIVFAWRLEDHAFNSETVDSKMKISWNTRLTSEILLSVGYGHTSGHASDDIEDKELLPLNVGIEELYLRVIYIGLEKWRVGGSLQPSIGPTEPTKNFFKANEFLEWFPWGHSQGVKALTPYLAVGVEEWGRDVIEISKHLQVGAYYGNHVEARHQVTVRFVLGAYFGPDTRLKYYLYKNTHLNILYFGTMFDL